MEKLSDTDELHLISEATNDDGTVTVELHDFYRNEDKGRVTVQFITPTGKTKKDVMDWPQRDSDKYKFVRIFNQAGYGIISAGEACENGATVKAEVDPWEIHAPEEQSRIETLQELYRSHTESDAWISTPKQFLIATIMAPIFIPILIVSCFVEEAGVSRDEIQVTKGAAITLIWVIIAIVILI